MAHAGAHDEHDTHDEGHDDEHDAHHDEPPPDEPVTPLWLTLLGAVLFVSAGLLFLLMTGSSSAPGGANGAASAKPLAERPAPAAQPQAPAQGQPNIRPVGNLPLLRGVNAQQH